MRSFNTPALLLVFALISSCDLIPAKPGVWKNATIESSKRQKFHTLTDSLFSYLKAEETDKAESMLSGDLLENNYNKRTRQVIGNHLKTDGYVLQNDYYAVNRLRHRTFIKPNTDSLKIAYTAVAKEMYIAFYLPTNTLNKQMITLVYVKLDYGWKIDKLEIEPYTHNGKTSAQLYQQAKALYNKGYLADAVNTMALAVNCARPSEEILYARDDDMRKFYHDIIYEANLRYKYPLVIKTVPTSPAIFYMGTQTLADGTYPAIYYLSKIKLKDTTALKAENQQVKNMIGKTMPGIDKDKKYLLYYIYNKRPTGTESSGSFFIKDKLY